MTQEKISLYYRAGSSDKEYHALIEEKDGGYVVNFSFGRRGSTLQTGTKTFSPVDYDTAKKIFDKLVREKTAKGYTPGSGGTPYSATINEERTTGILPQLLNPVDEDQATGLMENPAWWMQEKFDGRRVLIRKENADITGINRKGLSIGLPHSVVSCARNINASFVLDGEAIGEKLFAFDLLSLNGTDLRAQPYCVRLEKLISLIGFRDAINVVKTAATPAEKQSYLNRLREQKAEGVVFKRHDAAYSPGRPASGGSQLKYKFYTTASCIVARVNHGKRSVALELVDDAGQGVDVGNVTIPPNSKVPPPGTMVEVRFLYAYPGGSLYQPVFLCIRDDIRPEACTTAQLKYRAASDDEDA